MYLAKAPTHMMFRPSLAARDDKVWLMNWNVSNKMDPVLALGARICPYPKMTAVYIRMKPPTTKTGWGLYFL